MSGKVLDADGLSEVMRLVKGELAAIDGMYDIDVTCDAAQETLTAHVYRAGAELSALPAGHALKWYVDGALAQTDSALPSTLTRTAAQVAGKCVVRAQMEG